MLRSENARDMAFRQKSLSRQFFLSGSPWLSRSKIRRMPQGFWKASPQPSVVAISHPPSTDAGPSEVAAYNGEKAARDDGSPRASHPAGITYPLLFAVSVWRRFRRILELIWARSYLLNQNFRLV